MKLLWISGWAVPPTWLAEQAHAAFPDAKHDAVSPAEATATLGQKKYDALGGYSLGALWLLMHAEKLSETVPVILLAPIFSFAVENGDGGRITLAQLRLQRRRCRHDPAAAVADFYRRSGLENIVPAVSNLTASQTAALDTELGWLENWRAPAPPPKHWLGFAGENDALLDAGKLKEKWPDLRIVPATGHAPGPLLRAAAGEFPLKARQ